MTEEEFATIEEYASLTTQIKALEKARALIKPDVQAMIERVGKTECDGVTLSVGHRKKWQYPYPITEMEDELKEVKKLAEIDGDATSESKPYLIAK